MVSVCDEDVFTAWRLIYDTNLAMVYMHGMMAAMNGAIQTEAWNALSFYQE